MHRTAKPNGPPEAYQAAHELQYRDHDELGALDVYETLIARNPDSPEAGYAASQVRGLADKCVAAPALIAALAGLIRKSASHRRPPAPPAARS